MERSVRPHRFGKLVAGFGASGISLANLSDYILVVRHPTGGIRTHLKYGTQLAPHCESAPKPLLIAPDDTEGAAVAAAIRLSPERFCSRGARTVGALALAALRTAAKFRPRVIHSHGFTSAIAAAPAAALFRLRHIVTAHDVITPGLVATQPRISLWLLGMVLRRAFAIHAVGEDCAESIRTLPLLRRADNILVIRNGIDVEQFSNRKPVDIRALANIPDGAFVVGFFGRFMAQKGFRTLVESMALVKAQAPLAPIFAIAVGSGGFIREDQAYVRERNLDSTVRFLAPVEDPAPLIAAVDVVAMPSKWEAYSLLAAEVLTAGRPLIASDCIGLREVTRGTPAITFEAGNAQQLSNAILSEFNHRSIAAASAYTPCARRRFDVRASAASLQKLLMAANSGLPLPHDI